MKKKREILDRWVQDSRHALYRQHDCSRRRTRLHVSAQSTSQERGRTIVIVDLRGGISKRGARKREACKFNTILPAEATCIISRVRYLQQTRQMYRARVCDGTEQFYLLKQSVSVHLVTGHYCSSRASLEPSIISLHVCITLSSDCHSFAQMAR